MPVTVVVGGQYGSEGKGKVAYYLAQEKNAKIAVRVGGSNSGHTVYDEHGRKFIFRHLPTASLLPDVVCVLPSGSYIDVHVLLTEIEKAEIAPERLYIDPHAVLVTEKDKAEEHVSLKEKIGSTGSGTGAAVIRRIRRDNGMLFAQDEPLLQKYIQKTKPYMRENLQGGHRIIIEGTQGYGLSILHSDHYPYVTGRDTTAAGFVSETGLSPFDVDEIVLTIRAHPIRVGGNSGPLPYETDWETVTLESGSNNDIIEYTSVTNKIRRVARFHPEVVRQAILTNNPTSIVLNHLDYIDARCCMDNHLTEKVCDYVRNIENLIGCSINFFGIGPASFVKKGVLECQI
ncbi:MAG: adenylosuccinate synthetase [Candidatus Latescibacteria bacterium]|nr:adenylosuccinate synthetase [Candidatus Latescibacterota bacterium]